MENTGKNPWRTKGQLENKDGSPTIMNLGFFPQLRCGQHEASLAGTLADRYSTTSNEHACVGPSAAWRGVCHGADSVVENISAMVLSATSDISHNHERDNGNGGTLLQHGGQERLFFSDNI